MNPAKSNPLSKPPKIRLALSALLACTIVTSQCRACDFCVNIPRVPFSADQLSAIEVAVATRSAANDGLLDLNPVVVLTGHRNQIQEISLAELSPARLLSDWIATRPARKDLSLRCVCEVVFVDTDAAFRFDIRMGEIIGSEANGPPDLRIVTTKAGFVRLLELGLRCCEDEQLVVIETADMRHRKGIAQLLPGSGNPMTNKATEGQHLTNGLFATAVLKSAD